MAKLMRLEVNTSTGEEKLVEFSAEEMAEFEASQLALQAEEEAKAARAAAKAAILDRLGLTADEAKLLLS